MERRRGEGRGRRRMLEVRRGGGSKGEEDVRSQERRRVYRVRPQNLIVLQVWACEVFSMVTNMSMNNTYSMQSNE